MCDQATLDIIVEVVGDRVTEDEMFTAFDISREVQKRQCDEGCPFTRHRFMKNDIHREMEGYLNQGIYEKTLHDVGNGNFAFVYHPEGTDVNDYAAVTMPTIPNHSVTVPTPTVIDDDDDGDDTVIDTSTTSSMKSQINKWDDRKPDARGTLCIPASLIREIGAGPTQNVYVYDNSRCLIITTHATPAAIASYTVDSYSNVRITSATLGTVGLVGPTFDLEVMSECFGLPEVVIRNHE